jgi:uncharacterized protein (TIGR02284 family)
MPVAWFCNLLLQTKLHFMQNNNIIIEVLNDLIEINNDRIEGYQKAIDESKPADTDLDILFLSMIAESHQVKNALASQVEALGGDITNGTTTSGKIYRAWMDVKAVFTGHNRKTVLVNCEAGEDATQEAYKSALEQEGIPAYIRQMLMEQKDRLKGSHDEIKALRDQYSAVR